MPTGEPRDFSPVDGPDVEVLVDGTWYPGQLRAWLPRDNGWYGNVEYSTDVGENRLNTVPEHQIRRLN